MVPTMRMRCTVLLLAVGAGLLPARAADDAGQRREREAMRRAQAQAAQLRGEKEQVEHQLDEVRASEVKLKKELADASGRAAALRTVQRQVDGLRRQLEEEQGRTRAAAARVQALEAELARERERGAALELQAREAAAQAKGREEGLQASLSAEQGQGRDCRARNARLYQLGNEILQRYRDKGVMAALLAREPLTGIQRVQWENLAEDYEEALKAGRIQSMVK